MAGGEKERGREADACDSVGAVMRVPTSGRQSVRAVYTAHSRTHTHVEQRGSNGLAKAWGQSH